jgi:hypothetical protein
VTEARSLSCSQCGRSAPSETDELVLWKGGRLLLAGELDGIAAALLVCPDCANVDSSGDYDQGEGD